MALNEFFVVVFNQFLCGFQFGICFCGCGCGCALLPLRILWIFEGNWFWFCAHKIFKPSLGWAVEGWEVCEAKRPKTNHIEFTQLPTNVAAICESYCCCNCICYERCGSGGREQFNFNKYGRDDRYGFRSFGGYNVCLLVYLCHVAAGILHNCRLSAFESRLLLFRIWWACDSILSRSTRK